MTKNSALSFVLSQEELSIVLSYLKTVDMAGLDVSIFKGLGKKQIQMVLGVAERSLIARGFLVVGKDNRLDMAPHVFATVGACAFPESTILITESRPGIPESNYYFHSSRKMNVMHTVPMTAMHQFIAVEDRTAMTKAVYSILHLETEKVEIFPKGNVKRSTLNKAREAAQKKGKKSTISYLADQSALSADTARAFAEALERPLSNTMLAYIEKQGEIMEGCSILRGEKSLWWISPVDGAADDENAMVSVLSLSPDDARKKVASLLRL